MSPAFSESSHDRKSSRTTKQIGDTKIQQSDLVSDDFQASWAGTILETTLGFLYEIIC